MDLGQIGIMMTGFPESFIRVNQFLNATHCKICQRKFRRVTTPWEENGPLIAKQCHCFQDDSVLKSLNSHVLALPVLITIGSLC